MTKSLILLLLALGVAHAQQSAPKPQQSVTDLQTAAASGDKPALERLRIYAEQGNAEAQAGLGFIYAVGQGVPENIIQSVAWYRRAAEQGDATAQFNMGLAYAKGEGAPKDAVQAATWFRKAAEQGIAIAQFDLGKAYENGTGVAKDPAQAAACYWQAAELGNAEAQSSLGLLYSRGEGALKKDAFRAVGWYRKAADQGYADAQFNLGWMYSKGEGVPKDGAQAVAWYRKASDQGMTYAQTNLGVMYRDGDGVPKDSAQAAAWFRKAADQGEAKAQHELGLLYVLGAGVPKDYVTAYMWVNMAAAQGLQSAKEARDFLETKMTPEQISRAQRLSSQVAPQRSDELCATLRQSASNSSRQFMTAKPGTCTMNIDTGYNLSVDYGPDALHVSLAVNILQINGDARAFWLRLSTFDNLAQTAFGTKQRTIFDEMNKLAKKLAEQEMEGICGATPAPCDFDKATGAFRNLVLDSKVGRVTLFAKGDTQTGTLIFTASATVDDDKTKRKDAAASTGHAAMWLKILTVSLQAFASGAQGYTDAYNKAQASQPSYGASQPIYRATRTCFTNYLGASLITNCY